MDTPEAPELDHAEDDEHQRRLLFLKKKFDPIPRLCRSSILTKADVDQALVKHNHQFVSNRKLKRQSKKACRITDKKVANTPTISKRQSDIPPGFPNEMLHEIARHLCKTYEPNGIRGCSVVTKDLLNLSMVNRQFHEVSRRGFYLLGSASEKGTKYQPMDYKKLISDPQECSIEELRTFLETCIGISTKGEKNRMLH